MKAMAFILILSLLTSSAGAESIRLMGRGVKKKRSTESISLACVSDECKQVQFIFLESNHSRPQWIGPKINVPEAPTEELTEEAMATKVQYFMAINHDGSRDHGQAEDIRNKASWGVMIAGTGTALAIGPMSILTVGIIAIPIVLAGVFLRAFPPRSLDVFLAGTGNDAMISTANDQDRWNWSEEPKGIKAHKFDTLYRNIQSETRYFQYSYEKTDLQRAQEKMNKLQKQDVDFKLIHHNRGEL